MLDEATKALIHPILDKLKREGLDMSVPLQEVLELEKQRQGISVERRRRGGVYINPYADLCSKIERKASELSLTYMRKAVVVRNVVKELRKTDVVELLKNLIENLEILQHNFERQVLNTQEIVLSMQQEKKRYQY